MGCSFEENSICGEEQGSFCWQELRTSKKTSSGFFSAIRIQQDSKTLTYNFFSWQESRSKNLWLRTEKVF
jgi:hypothetical protein